MIGLCEMFSCLPSALLAEDAELLRLLYIRKLGTPARDDAATGGGGWPTT